MTLDPAGLEAAAKALHMWEHGDPTDYAEPDYRECVEVAVRAYLAAAARAAATPDPPEGCRAPHCWSEYGTPCGDCPSEPRPDPDVRDGDWRCLCGDLNREHEACCFRCGGGNPAEPMPDEPFFTDQQERSLARCEAFDRASEPRKETT